MLWSRSQTFLLELEPDPVKMDRLRAMLYDLRVLWFWSCDNSYLRQIITMFTQIKRKNRFTLKKIKLLNLFWIFFKTVPIFNYICVEIFFRRSRPHEPEPVKIGPVKIGPVKIGLVKIGPARHHCPWGNHRKRHNKCHHQGWGNGSAFRSLKFEP